MTNEFTVGSKVYFGRKNGEKTLGEIIKVNRKTYKIRQLESRGMYRNHAVGTRWTVAKSLVWSAEENRPEHVTRKPRSEFPKRACLVDVMTGKKTYGALCYSEDEYDAECEMIYGRLANF